MFFVCPRRTSTDFVHGLRKLEGTCFTSECVPPATPKRITLSPDDDRNPSIAPAVWVFHLGVKLRISIRLADKCCVIGWFIFSIPNYVRCLMNGLLPERIRWNIYSQLRFPFNHVQSPKVNPMLARIKLYYIVVAFACTPTEYLDLNSILS